MRNLYHNKTPFKAIYILEVCVGTCLLAGCAFLILNEIYLDIWTYAGPLLGLALVITGLTSSKIKEVNLNVPELTIEISKESLFKSSITHVKVENLRVELKTANGKKKGLILKLRLVVLDLDKEVDELQSNFLSMNNPKIKRLYADLKEIVKAATANTSYQNGNTK